MPIYGGFSDESAGAIWAYLLCRYIRERLNPSTGRNTVMS